MTEARAGSRRARPRSPWPRRIVVIVLVLLVFLVGIAIGKALNDGPPTPATETYVRTLTTLTGQTSTSGP